MSIDARIAGVSVGPNGTFLNLEPRERKGKAGQSRLEVLNPPDPPVALGVMVGVCIWGGSGSIVWGDVEIAKRKGYCAIVLDYEKLKKAAALNLPVPLAEKLIEVLL